MKQNYGRWKLWRWEYWAPLDYLGLVLAAFVVAAFGTGVAGYGRQAVALAACSGAVLLAMVIIFFGLCLVIEDPKED